MKSRKRRRKIGFKLKIKGGIVEKGSKRKTITKRIGTERAKNVVGKITISAMGYNSHRENEKPTRIDKNRRGSNHSKNEISIQQDFFSP